jgi:hypothetical protein
VGPLRRSFDERTRTGAQQLRQKTPPPRSHAPVCSPHRRRHGPEGGRNGGPQSAAEAYGVSTRSHVARECSQSAAVDESVAQDANGALLRRPVSLAFSRPYCSIECQREAPETKMRDSNPGRECQKCQTLPLDQKKRNVYGAESHYNNGGFNFDLI